MESANLSLRRKFNRYVSTACDACRKKRCKCDGRSPCLSCRTTDTVCTYGHNDGRRERHRQHGAFPDSHQVDVQSTSAETIDARPTDEPVETGRDSLGGQDGGSEYAGHRIRIRTSVLRNGDSDPQRLDKLPEQDTQQETERVTDLHSRPAQTVTRNPTNLKILPKPTTTNRSPSRREQPDIHVRTSYALRRISRRGYAVPGYTRTFGNLPMSSSIKANGYPIGVQAQQVRNITVPEHLMSSLLEADDSPLGRAYTDFQELGRRLIAQGAPSSQVADSGPIDVTLFFRDRTPEDPINASMWAAEMLRAFRGVLADELLLACAVCSASLMRWSLVPTAKNYANIPAVARPTQMQTLKPHPAWIDLMIFPTFRNALISNLREWVGPCTRAEWKVLWPHSLDDAVFEDPKTRRTYLKPEFVSYAVDPNHWTMRRSILEDFPDIEGSEMVILAD